MSVFDPPRSPARFDSLDLTGCLAGWLAGLVLAGWLADWLAGRLVGRLASWMAGWPAGWMAGQERSTKTIPRAKRGEKKNRMPGLPGFPDIYCFQLFRSWLRNRGGDGGGVGGL